MNSRTGRNTSSAPGQQLGKLVRGAHPLAAVGVERLEHGKRVLGEDVHPDRPVPARFVAISPVLTVFGPCSFARAVWNSCTISG
jgi:hypothetical protein